MKKYEEVEGIDTSTIRGAAISECRTKFRGILGEDLVIAKLLDFITLMSLNNKFANRGIYITDENREESYIKIIETGEDGLIDDLEKYINLMDQIKIIEGKRSEYEGLVEKIKNLDEINDFAEIKKMTLKYTRR